MWTRKLGAMKLFPVLVLSLVAFAGAAATKPNILVILAAALRQQIQRAGAVPWQAPEHTP